MTSELCIEDLWEQYRAATGQEKMELRNQLAEYYLPFCYGVATDLSRKLLQRVPLADLKAEGAMGMLQAIERYDPSRACSFKTFAYTRIWGQMMDYVRKIDPVPRTTRDIDWDITQKREQMEQERGGPVTIDDVLKAMGIDDYHQKLSHYDATLGFSLEGLGDAEHGGDMVPSFNGHLTDHKIEDPNIRMRRCELVAALRRFLTLRERRILIYKCFYGMKDKEVARRLGCSPSLISMKFTDIKEKLHGKEEELRKYF